MKSHWGITLSMVAGMASSAMAQPHLFSTNEPDLKIGVASRIETENAVEIEAADDFLLSTDTRLTGATVFGVIPAELPLTNVKQVSVQIYRVFPLDSNADRVARVPTRANSPSDVAFETRDSGASTLKFVTTLREPAVTALNSVVDGINPSPAQTTGGEGASSGQEVVITVTFDKPIDLPPGHYFLVPQVRLKSGNFLWLSAPRPITAPGTPFTPDLQAWVRSSRLDPDWLRVGGDIVGGNPAPTFNLAFRLEGAPRCYANCDNSTMEPVLNVADFSCFLNQFATGNKQANCDGSTIEPVLNVKDFACFLNRFAAGCS